MPCSPLSADKPLGRINVMKTILYQKKCCYHDNSHKHSRSHGLLLQWGYIHHFVYYHCCVDKKKSQASHYTSHYKKYEHGQALELMGNIWNIKICMGEKTYRFCNLRKWMDYNKNSLPHIKCVLHLFCVVHRPIYDRFMGGTVNGFLSSLYSLRTYVPTPSKTSRLFFLRERGRLYTG